MKEPKSGKQYIFLDESGRPEIIAKSGVNLVTTNQTSKFLVISIVTTSTPIILQEQVLKFKLKCLTSADIIPHITMRDSLEVLHASNDPVIFRDIFFKEIASMSDFKSLILVAEKLKAYEGYLRNPELFYNGMCGELLKRILHTHEYCDIVLSRKDKKLGIQKNLNAEIERLKVEFFNKYGITVNPKLEFYHNPYYSHSALQIADYIGWAVSGVFERSDRKYYDIIKSKISFIQDIFNRVVYTKQNPL